MINSIQYTQDTQEDLYNLLKILKLPVRILNNNMNYWFVRTESGKYYKDFLFNSYIAVGWNYINILSKDNDDEKTIKLIKEKYPDAIPGRVLNPIKRFCQEMQPGDLVIIPSTSSATFAFGIIKSDPYIETIKEQYVSDDLSVSCPYIKRRTVKWLSSLERHRLDPNLFQFFRAHQTISNATRYADYINRTLNTLYIKNDIAHIILDVCTQKNIPANKLIKFISGLLNYLNKVTDDPTASNDIDIKLNVQSPGILEFIGSPIKIAIIALIFLFIVGGEAKFSKQGYDIEFSLKTQGLIEKGIQYYERVLKENIDPSELKDEIEQLKIKDPTGIPRV